MSINDAMDAMFKTLDNMCDNIDFAGKALGLDDDIQMAARFELALFLMYLSYSDFNIDPKEVRLISGVCRTHFTEDQILDTINDPSVFPDFKTHIPLSFKIMVQFDNKLREQNERSGGWSEAFITFYRLCGETLINVDSKVDYFEKSDLDDFINLLTDYRNDNYVNNSGTSIDFAQTASSIKTPKKNGVAAPTKR